MRTPNEAFCCSRAAIAEREQCKARFGVRIRLRTTGAGKWADSGGYRSKFGISLPELMDLVERLEADDMRESFVLLHFHLGSQISDIQQLRSAAKEMSQIYAELIARGIPIRYLDVGGGIAGDFPICVVPMLQQDLQREDTPRWGYFCQISDSTTSYGSYSGAVPNEKITWGKLSADTPKFIIESDATIVAPLIFASVLEQ